MEQLPRINLKKFLVFLLLKFSFYPLKDFALNSSEKVSWGLIIWPQKKTGSSTFIYNQIFLHLPWTMSSCPSKKHWSCQRLQWKEHWSRSHTLDQVQLQSQFQYDLGWVISALYASDLESSNWKTRSDILFSFNYHHI